MFYDKTDDANPLSLPPESNMPYTHSTNITNNGEILLLPLFSSVYQMEQSNEIDNVIHLQSSTEAKTTAPVIRTDIESTKDVSSNSNVVAAVDATATGDNNDNDDNNVNEK